MEKLTTNQIKEMSEDELVKSAISIERMPDHKEFPDINSWHDERIRREKTHLKLVKTLTGLTKSELSTASWALQLSRFDQERGVIFYNRGKGDTHERFRPTEHECLKLCRKGYLIRLDRRISVADFLFKVPVHYYWSIDSRIVKWRDAIGHWGWY